jgi:hypothetical protein
MRCLIVEPRMYRPATADRIAPSLLAACWGVVFIVLCFHVNGNVVFALPLVGVGEAFCISFAAMSFRRATVISDEGVRAAGPRSPVIPWPEIESFTAGHSGREAPVRLTRAGGSGPVELDGAFGPLSRTQGIADELNAMLQSRRPSPQPPGPDQTAGGPAQSG